MESAPGGCDNPGGRCYCVGESTPCRNYSTPSHSWKKTVKEYSLFSPHWRQRQEREQAEKEVKREEPTNTSDSWSVCVLSKGD